MRLSLQIDIDDRHWWTLADRADADRTRVADMIEAEVRAAIVRLTSHQQALPADVVDDRGPNPYAKDRPYRDALRRELIQRMWVNGHSSVAIGARMGTTNLRKVRATLWDLGYNPRDRIGHPPAGHRARPVNMRTKETA